jgi:alkylation response protein AidB-like acyl-CoA dehydrogenase
MQDQKVTSLPPLANRYESDPALKRIIGGLSKEAANWATPRLRALGEKSATALVELAQTANQNIPKLSVCDRFGNRVDNIEFHPSYRALRQSSYGEGIVGSYYDSKVRAVLAADSEVIKFAEGYLFSQAEQGLYCPICMTDGVAFLVEKYGTAQQKSHYLPHLTSCNLDSLWEGAMFLTERAGGSDVGATETIAKPVGTDGRYALYGQKWFCSNAGAEAAAVLARVEGGKPGTHGLGLFLMRRHDDDGKLNNQTMERLKDKLGTRSMPTGEITLEGAIAEPLGDLSRGFVQMADMLNLSRLYNATASIAVVRSVLSEALRYCHYRRTFGHRLNEYPLVQEKLVELAVEWEASMHTLFTVHGLRGKVLAGIDSESDRKLLRIMTPLLKYRTASLAVRAASDCLELHGGCGYIEDWTLARMFRDAQVLPVWEGTTNMMVLDAVRSMVKDNAHEALFDYIRQRSADDRIRRRLGELQETCGNVIANSSIEAIDGTAKLWCDQAFELAQAATLMPLCIDERGKEIAEQYIMRHLTPGNTDYLQRARRNCATILASKQAACMT